MKKSLMAGMLILAMGCLPARLYASSSIAHATDVQFAAGTLARTQINGTGVPAFVQLMFQFQPVAASGTPPVRRHFSFAYDEGQGIAVMFGGDEGTTVYGDLWELDLARGVWSQPNVLGDRPGPLFGHGMVPIGGGRILLFGGKDSTYAYYNETWMYDAQNKNWANRDISISTAPCPRINFTLAVDTSRGKVVLFGGEDESSQKLSDTWVYDIAGGTWTLMHPVTSPSPRTGAAMAFNASNKLTYLFGGYDGTNRLQDTWTYDAGANTWTNLNLTVGQSPTARENASMFCDTYDPLHPMVIFGGQDSSIHYCSDVWYFTGAQWNSGGSPMNPVAPRKGAGCTFLRESGQALVFGGYDATTSFMDSSCYVFRSTGNYTSPVVDVPFATSLQWLKLKATPTPVSNVTFQLSSSNDNISWSSYTGPDGTSNSMYVCDINGEFSIHPGHNGNRYMRYRAYLTSSQLPSSSQIDSVTLTFNRSPFAPSLSAPLQGDTTNYRKPFFTWINASDSDNDALTYQLQVDNEPGFVSPVTISTGSIPQSAGTYTTFVATTSLDHGLWYWRVRANDGTVDGEWSDTFVLNIDTIAPRAVVDLVAQPGPGNGQATLRWTSPGNNGDVGAVVNGAYEVRFSSSGPVVSEEAYAALTGSRTVADYYSPGVSKAVAVSGLAAGVTYYFSLKVRDDAGNFSALSLTSPAALTNAPPAVQLLTPVGGEVNWNGRKEVSWVSSDPNPGDTRTFNLYVSSDSGATYGVTLATGLPNGTTCYLWDTRLTCNGDGHRIKVEAVDAMGAKGAAVSGGDFSVYNPNQEPAVTVIYPDGGETTFGTVNLQWAVFDFNKADTHTFDVFLSSNSGATFGWHYVTSTTTWQIDTRDFPNGPCYRLKVKATDSGIPVAYGEDYGNADFAISNGNQPPLPFALTAPLDGSERSIIDMAFAWENRGDPNPEDTLHYTLYYSTSPDFIPASSISGITTNSCRLPYYALTEETLYYWKVTAKDPLGLDRNCAAPFSAYALSRFKTASADGKVSAQIDTMPDNGFLKIEKVDPRGVRAVREADEDARIDRHLKTLGDDVYRLAVCDSGGNELKVASPRITLFMKYPDTDGNNYYDGTLVPAGGLRCAVLDEELRRWETLSLPPVLDTREKRLASMLTRLGTVTLIGATSPAAKISDVVNYPNPFCAGSEETRVRYVLAEDSDVDIRIYTMTGDLVWEKSFGSGKEGGKGQSTGYTNEIRWDGRNSAGMTVANGMYLMEIKAGSTRQLRKIGVIK